MSYDPPPSIINLNLHPSTTFSTKHYYHIMETSPSVTIPDRNTYIHKQDEHPRSDTLDQQEADDLHHLINPNFERIAILLGPTTGSSTQAIEDDVHGLEKLTERDVDRLQAVEVERSFDSNSEHIAHQPLSVPQALSETVAGGTTLEARLAKKDKQLKRVRAELSKCEGERMRLKQEVVSSIRSPLNAQLIVRMI